ncbi:MAG: NAD-dependent protein deacylase [Clostridia bacterium]|nr:NAD-dependent protein deacylase [Clostridia bacterium]
MDKINLLQSIIDKSKNAVFFGGAGVSTESGIPDFRSQDGLYNMKYAYPPEQIVSHTFFKLRTGGFFDFYRDKMVYPSAKPNPAHIFLAKMEDKGKLKAVITQNIDGLHQAAGSKNVFELHGSVLRNYCTRCGKFYSVEFIKSGEGVPLCACGGIIKPDVVLYEEGLDDKTVNGAISAIAAADTLIIGGTSLAVYPAAGFIDYFRGEHLVVINKSPTPADFHAELVINEPIGETFSKLKI